jgi:phage-related protein
MVLARALSLVAEGGFPDIAKPMKGFGSGVNELALRHRGDAYRAVYAVQIGQEIWRVLGQHSCKLANLVVAAEAGE